MLSQRRIGSLAARQLATRLASPTLCAETSHWHHPTYRSLWTQSPIPSVAARDSSLAHKLAGGRRGIQWTRRPSHLQDSLVCGSARITVNTKYGPVTGGQVTHTGTAGFLEIPYALPPGRFQDPEPLPANYRYEAKEYLYEASYCAQPNDGILIPPRTPYQNLVGLGNPTENPLYVNIVCPPGWSPGSDRKYPVKIYIHGGFLQLGSPHELNSQAEYIAKESETVHVNIGYRVSAFGFLASDEPRLDGNFGFKDQWLGLLWVRDNIECFGGDPTNIQLTGLSAGAHSVHQILHHVSRLPEGEKSPFQSATLQSNGMMANPATPAGQRPQFDALCHSLGLDPRSPTILSQLRDTSALPFNKITQVIESGEIGTEFDTFRGTRDSTWTGDSPDPMTWQRSGEFARALKAKGVRSVVVGDLTEEWFIYAMTHPVYSYADVEANLRKFYPRDVVARLLECYETEPQNLFRFMGKVLSDCQVYLPTRLLARDLYNAGFPVLRYEIGWVPQAVYSSIGYVTHGLDRTIWADRQTLISQPEHLVVLAWLDAIDAQRKAVEEGTSTDAQDIKRVFALKKDMSMGWKDDARWDEVKGLIAALPGEN